MNQSDEAAARKEQSIQRLRTEGVPVIDHLPMIESEAQSTRRTTLDVAERAICLMIVAVKGEGLDNEIVQRLVKDFQVESALTPQEKAFIANPEPNMQLRTQFSWKYEAYWVLLWSLGLVDELSKPDQICDVSKAVGILKELGRDGLLAKSELRPQSEILDQADLIYRYHWATTDARINGKPMPAGLDNGVVFERHHALNWLIGYMDQLWDDITTDT